MSYFSVGYFGPPPVVFINPDEELAWEFVRFWPAPGISLPAASTERHLVRVKAARPDGPPLTALELAAFGIEIAYHKGDGAPLVYHAMQPDTVRNTLAATVASHSFYFSLLVGPNADIILASGAWLVSVRVASSPKVVRDLSGLLTLTP